MSTDDNQFERIPWAEVWMRLRAISGWLTHGQPDIFDAVSTEDLVNETFLDFLIADHLGWVPSRGPLEAFLGTILKHKFIDHLRRQAVTAGNRRRRLFSASIRSADWSRRMPLSRSFGRCAAIKNWRNWL